MNGRKTRVDTEAAALWRELYDEPPPAADGRDVLGLMLQRLPAPRYERLSSPWLRRKQLSWPKSR